jgi:hypothetical protein
VAVLIAFAVAFAAFSVAFAAFATLDYAKEHNLKKNGMLLSCLAQFIIVAFPMLYVVLR